MKTYQINELERLTGIKAHTIRIWEKRYGLIEPERTVTNRRCYSDEQVRKLLNVTTLLDKGHKISHIAALTDHELKAEIRNEDEAGPTGSNYSGYINDLVKSMISFDEPAFEKIFSAAVTRLGLYDTMLHVIYPFLKKVGVLWTVDEAEPVQEHFATCIIKRKLMAAIDGLMPPTNRKKKFLLFLPNHEWHEIALLFSDYIIRSRGFETIYLGQDVPDENVLKIAEQIDPAYMLTFFIATRPREEAQAIVKRFAKSGAGTQVLVAGNIDVFAGQKNKPKNVTYLSNINSLLELLDGLAS